MATYEELLERDDVKTVLEQLKATPALATKRLRPIDTPAGLMVIRNPTKGEWNVMRAIAWDDDKANASKSMEGLVRGIAVYPDKATLTRWDEDYAGLWDNPSIVKEVRRHCGHETEAHAK